MKQKIAVKDMSGNIIKQGELIMPNKEHLKVQQTMRSAVFVDKKKRAKKGYRKHKKVWDSSNY